MAEISTFQAPTGNGPKQWVLIALGAVLAIALVWFIYRVMTEVPGVAVQEAPPTVVDMLPPPPPPPPPPPEPQEKPPEPTEKSVPDPNPAPVPDKPAPAPMQIDGPAQAGTDAFGMSAGRGGGMGAPSSQGNCLGTNCGPRAVAGVDRFWGRNVANALEAHIESSRSVNVDSFTSEFDVWVNSAGALTEARLVKSSGNARLDQAVLALLNSARGLKPPPESIRMPQRIKVGRKRF